MTRIKKKMVKWYMVAAFWLGLLLATFIAPYLFPVSGMTTPVYYSLPQVIRQDNLQATGVEKITPEMVKEFIKKIFGKNWKVAWAVSQSECGLKNVQWPVCVNSWEREHSIGVFQINMKAHNDKIPGNTWAEKEVWLSDYRNNILIAFKIFSDSGWYPWTGFTSGNYKSFL